MSFLWQRQQFAKIILETIVDSIAADGSFTDGHKTNYVFFAVGTAYTILIGDLKMREVHVSAKWTIHLLTRSNSERAQIFFHTNSDLLFGYNNVLRNSRLPTLSTTMLIDLQSLEHWEIVIDIVVQFIILYNKNKYRYRRH